MVKITSKSIKYSITKTPDDCVIFRDNAPLKTPAGADFIVPTLPLAESVVDEWQRQTDKINPATMPLTQLAATAIDIVAKDSKKIISQLTGYIGSELLCHRAEDSTELAKHQQEVWQPILDWCARRFDVGWRVGAGIMPNAQSPETSNRLRRAMESSDPFYLAGLHYAVDVSSSLVLGLALAECHVTAAAAFAASELDARFQIQKWGEDPATAKRHEGIQRDLSLCERWFELLRE